MSVLFKEYDYSQPDLLAQYIKMGGITIQDFCSILRLCQPCLVVYFLSQMYKFGAQLSVLETNVCDTCLLTWGWTAGVGSFPSGSGDPDQLAGLVL